MSATPGSRQQGRHLSRGNIGVTARGTLCSARWQNGEQGGCDREEFPDGTVLQDTKGREVQSFFNIDMYHKENIYREGFSLFIFFNLLIKVLVSSSL